MSRCSLWVPLLATGLMTSALGAAPGPAPASAKKRDAPRLAHLPSGLAVEAVGDGTGFVARGAGVGAWLSSTGATLYRAHGGDHRVDAGLRVRFAGARSGVWGEAGKRLLGEVNYVIGRDASGWRTGCARYGDVRFSSVYPGIDVRYHAAEEGGRPGRALEYDFLVSRGADPGAVALRFDDDASVRCEADGSLSIRTHTSRRGEERYVQKAPMAYQEIGGQRRAVTCRYRLANGASVVRLELGPYDRGHALVIDPAVNFSTYLGGSAEDYGLAVAVDSSRNIYVAGETTSLDFLVRNAGQTRFGGGGTDAFITKLKPGGDTVVYSTYLGGLGDEFCSGIAVDGSGQAYVTGATGSADFPLLKPAQRVFRNGGTDAFVTKLSTSGRLVYSTYVGGSDADEGQAIAVDSTGRAYITGVTRSLNFPVTAGVFQRTFGGGLSDTFVTRLSANGQLFDYSTYLGGSDEENPVKLRGSIAVDTAGHAYVSGTTRSNNFPVTAMAFQRTRKGGMDAFIAKLGIHGESLSYSTFLGGTDDDWSLDLAVDANGSAYVTGDTASLDFPVTTGSVQTVYGGGATEAFVARITPDGQDVIFSTYLGGQGDESSFSGLERYVAGGIALDPLGNCYVTGRTDSADFPVVRPFQLQAGGFADGYVTKLNDAGDRILYSSRFGGSSDDAGMAIALDALGSAVVTGWTASLDLPVFRAGQPTYAGGFADAFVLKVDEPEGQSPHLSLSAAILRFPPTRPGQTAQLTLQLTNQGRQTLTGRVGTLSAPFSVISGGGSFSLAFGHSQTVTIKFAPTHTGNFAQTLSIPSNDPEHPTSHVRLIARGGT